MNNFAPLHVFSGYSFLQSGLTINKIAVSVSKNDYYGVGLTDKGVLFGAHEFIDTIAKINKKSILGCEIKVNEDNLSLFVKNEEGYRNLLKILFLINAEKFTIKDLKNHSEGLIAVIESKYGDFRRNFQELGVSNEFAKYLIHISEGFNDNFYLGIEVTSREDIIYANKVREFASKYTYKTVAFPRIKYVKKEDAIVLEIVNAIENNEEIEEKSKDGQEYFMKETDYQKIYTQSEINMTREIIDSSTFDIHLKRGTLLKFVPNNSKQLLKDNCYKSLYNKGLNNETYTDRLDYELSVIDKMGYNDYFLLVQDYVNYAKENNIVVGPGRGSAAGSLVSYLLNITEINPLDYNLQFERFLNPARETMPDIDCDFMDIKRDALVDYVRNKYGKNRVANIVTFQRILAKQALRDIQRVYKYPTNHIDMLSKALPKGDKNKDLTLREAYKIDAKFRSIIDSDKYFLEIVSLASKIEGLPRQAGMHAAGVVLNEDAIENVMPVTIDLLGNYCTQYEMEYLEQEGFLKMDFLSLRNLTIIDLAVKMINANNPGLNLNPYNIPYDSPEIFEVIRNTHTMGIFQLESAGMKRAIKILKPNCFEDVVALLALFRPGPMDSIKLYAARKEGKQSIPYISPALKEILAPTYGIIVYQEQINKIAQVMAGFSPAQADVFRRAVSKKVKEKILAAKGEFISGSIKNGYSEKVANQVFDLILKFANYGFNKSHSVVYSVVACRLAYLKVHYPTEFYSAILQIGSAVNDSKFNEYISEMKNRNFKIYSPDINNSTLLFASKDNGILFPLSAIKGVNHAMAVNIIEERKESPFTGFYNFTTRMFEYKISEKECLALINSGALDSLCSSRASMRASLKGALQFAELNHSEDGQLSMGFMEALTPKMTEVKDDPYQNLELEYGAIGIMLSDNPIRFKKEKLNNIEEEISSITDLDNGEISTIACLIQSVKKINTKKNETMAFTKVIDETGELEVTVFPRVYTECFEFLEKDKFVLIKGRVEINDSEEKNMIADSITLLEEEE